mgnify:CR=1 FL=1
MLTTHQFYKRVAFGLTEKDDIKNPLEDSIKQLSNTNLVSWNHAIPTMLDGINKFREILIIWTVDYLNKIMLIRRIISKAFMVLS